MLTYGRGAHTRGNITHINLAGNGIKMLNGHEFRSYADVCFTYAANADLC
jgi:hypothetical protein